MPFPPRIKIAACSADLASRGPRGRTAAAAQRRGAGSITLLRCFQDLVQLGWAGVANALALALILAALAGGPLRGAPLRPEGGLGRSRVASDLPPCQDL